jgi:uncharacterized delta-60 repeat protein
VLIVIISTLTFLPHASAQASLGNLDISFGAGGKVTTDFFGSGEQANGIAIQSDGRIVAAGAVSNGTHSDFAIARYNSNGTLDATFGTNGKVATGFSNTNDFAYALAIQSDGRIVAAGVTDNGPNIPGDFAVIRYNNDGSLDESFGDNGKVSTDFFGGDDSAHALKIQSDGKIVVAGTAGVAGEWWNFAVARYNSDGSLDAGFGNEGRVTTDFFGLFDSISGVDIQPDGRIVVAGVVATTIAEGAIERFALARYNSDGTLDSTFGDNGKALADFSGKSARAKSVIIQDGGRILAVGEVLPRSWDFAIVGYNKDGKLDTLFGNNGMVVTDFFGRDDRGAAVALKGDGRFVVAGTVSTSATIEDFGLAHYNSDGSLDERFGAGGKITTDFFGDEDIASAVSVQTDGQIIVAGLSFEKNAFTGDFALAQFTTAINPDFGLAPEINNTVATRGKKKKVSININRSNGFDGIVTVTAPDLETLNIKVKGPSSISTTGSTARFKLKVTDSTPRGNHVIVFVGRDNAGRERTASLTLTVE